MTKSKSSRHKTGFDKFFDEQMRDAKFREGYEKIRREVDASSTVSPPPAAHAFDFELYGEAEND
ncbi:MAG: hypothetical protein Q8P20_00595 [bacterium]|nr:hypothetical protein [bacterium]